jgi:hypothetical protein
MVRQSRFSCNGSERRIVSLPDCVIQAETRQPEVCQPEVCQPEVCQPEVCQPEVCQPEVCQPEFIEGYTRSYFD